ncbi:MAG: flagellar basal body rod protein FlgB [Alphaproteobacteria bacterium]
MNYSDISLLNVMKSKLGYLSARQSAIAQNVANADTPDYRARDIAEPDFKKMAMLAGSSSAQKLPMHTTNANHMIVAGHVAAFEATERKNTYELNPDGNNVTIEEEMMKAAENQAEYTKVLNLYRKTVDMFKIAIGRPGGGG